MLFSNAWYAESLLHNPPKNILKLYVAKLESDYHVIYIVCGLCGNVFVFFGKYSFNKFGILFAEFLNYLVRTAIYKLACIWIIWWICFTLSNYLYEFSIISTFILLNLYQKLLLHWLQILHSVILFKMITGGLNPHRDISFLQVSLHLADGIFPEVKNTGS